MDKSTVLQQARIRHAVGNDKQRAVKGYRLDKNIEVYAKTLKSYI